MTAAALGLGSSSLGAGGSKEQPLLTHVLEKLPSEVRSLGGIRVLELGGWKGPVGVTSKPTLA